MLTSLSPHLNGDGQHNGSPTADSGQSLGQVTKITGSQIIVTGQIDESSKSAIGAGALVKICGYRDVIGIANSIELDTATRTRIICVGLVGEITGSGEPERSRRHAREQRAAVGLRHG
ncbi:MAG: hypothetical protein ABSF08_07745 [Candidatus Cybelea sp.]